MTVEGSGVALLKKRLTQSLRLPPLVLLNEHGAELSEVVGRVVERVEDDGPLVDRERKERDAVPDSLLKPDGEIVSAGGSNHADEVGDGRLRYGYAGEYHGEEATRAGYTTVPAARARRSAIRAGGADGVVRAAARQQPERAERLRASQPRSSRR